MPAPLPLPEFKGFTIKKFDVHTQLSEQMEALYEARYLETPYRMDYDAPKYFYRLFLKVQYTGEEPGVGGWPPIIFAIIYSGEEREEDTMIMPLVAPQGLGPSHASPLFSREYEKNPEKIMGDNMISMQQRHPHLSDFYYGFVQLDYHHSVIAYNTGLHTIEVKLGTGKIQAVADQWTEPHKYQWNITKYTPPSESEAMKSRKKKPIIYI